METESRPPGGGGMAELLAALVRARAKFAPIVKDAKNPHLGNAYATLAGVLEAIDGPLTEEGLALTQTLVIHGDQMADGRWPLLLRTELHHVGGAEMYGVVPVYSSPNRGTSDMQALGAATTYARRQGITTLLCLAAEDDDGQSAGGGGQREEPRGQGQHQHQQRRGGDGRDRAQGDRPTADRRESPQARARREHREWPEGFPREFDGFARKCVETWNDAWKQECVAAGVADDWTEEDNLTSSHRLLNALATLAIDGGLLAEADVCVTNTQGEAVRDRARARKALGGLYAADPRAVGRLAGAYRARRLAEERERLGLADRQLQEAAG